MLNVAFCPAATGRPALSPSLHAIASMFIALCWNDHHFAPSASASLLHDHRQIHARMPGAVEMIGTGGEKRPGPLGHRFLGLQGFYPPSPPVFLLLVRNRVPPRRIFALP